MSQKVNGRNLELKKFSMSAEICLTHLSHLPNISKKVTHCKLNMNLVLLETSSPCIFFSFQIFFLLVLVFDGTLNVNSSCYNNVSLNSIVCLFILKYVSLLVMLYSFLNSIICLDFIL